MSGDESPGRGRVTTLKNDPLCDKHNKTRLLHCDYDIYFR